MIQNFSILSFLNFFAFEHLRIAVCVYVILTQVLPADFSELALLVQVFAILSATIQIASQVHFFLTGMTFPDLVRHRIFIENERTRARQERAVFAATPEQRAIRAVNQAAWDLANARAFRARNREVHDTNRIAVLRREARENRDTTVGDFPYEPQSGYGASKYHSRVNGAKASVKRDLERVNATAKQCKNAKKDVYKPVKEVLKKRLKKFEPHAGFSDDIPSFDYFHRTGPGFSTSTAQFLFRAYSLIFVCFLSALSRVLETFKSHTDIIDAIRRYKLHRATHLMAELSVLGDVLEPMAFTGQFTSALSTLRTMTRFNADNIENWITVTVGLMACDNVVSASALLLTHFKTYCNKSLAVQLTDFFTSTLNPIGECEPHSLVDIVRIFKASLRDWKSLTKSPLFARITDVMSLVVGSGLCSAYNIDFNVLGVPMFSENLRKRIDNAGIFEVAEMILECTTYFLEVGYMCFTQRSFRPILFDNVEAYDYEKKLLEFYRITPMVCDGDWEQAEVTYDEYVASYDDLYSYMHALHSGITRGPEKTLIWNKLVNITNMKNDFDRRHNAGSMRMSPYVMCFCGPSSVGKTSIASILNMVAVKASGGTGDQAKKITWNDGDDYFSNYKADTETIVMDDMCNTKAAFVKESPLSHLIKFNNNNPEYAVMADLPSKGKISIRPKTVVITTNVETLMAPVYSNEPVSILRRLDVRVRVAVKPEFARDDGGSGNLMLDPEKAAAYVASLEGSAALYPDMWYLTAERCVAKENATAGLPDTAHFEVLVHDKRALARVSLVEVAEYIAHAAKAHSTTQARIVARQTVMHNDVHLCPVCGSLDLNCKCKMDPHVGDGLTGVGFTENLVAEPEEVDHVFAANERSWWDVFPYWMQHEIIPFIRYLLSVRFGYDFLVRNFWILVSIVIAWVPYILACFYTLTGFTTVSCVFGILFSSFSVTCGMVRLYLNFTLLRWRLGGVYRGVRATMRNAFREEHIFRTAVMCGKGYLSYLFLSHVIRGAIRMYGAFNRLKMETQSALDPDPHEYVERRQGANPWTMLPTSRLPNSTHASKTTCWRTLTEMVKKNLVHVKHGTQVVDGFYIRTHILVLPKHFVDGDMELIITPRLALKGNHHKYTVRVSEKISYMVPDSDFCVVYAPGGCEKKDYSDYLPADHIKDPRVCRFSFRQSDGSILLDRARVTFGRVSTTIASYMGGTYSFETNKTFRGMCMGIFVSESKAPFIAGFHLGGVTDTAFGCLGTLLRSDVEKAMLYLSKLPGVYFGGQEAPIPTVMYEEHLGSEPFVLDCPIAPRCPTNFLPEDASIIVHGPCKGAVTATTKVIVSHISEAVEKHCGDKRAHGPPPMGPPLVPPWHNWSKGMEGFSTPCKGPFATEIIRASEDYIATVAPKFHDIKPMDMETIVNGLDGDRFINRMPQNTSVGYPLSGPLSNFSIAEPPVLGHSVNWSLDPSILEVYEAYEAEYASGRRCYPVFRATLKDEPVKIGKLKVRVFQAAPVALKMILRKYFLPLAAHMSMFPLITECAVGINAFSMEWDEMMDFVKSKGNGKIVAGDYSAYDQRMPSSLTGAAFAILIALARNCQYSPQDLRVMDTVVADVIYPLIAYNGTLVQLCGGNPSGHNLTVYINSIVNSLISRCAFFSVYPEKRFRDHVNMITYGDDDIGSVSDECPKFNNVTKSDYITSMGMTYTPPSKSGEHVDYMDITDVDFLKRKDVYNAELGFHVGVLEMSSVMKSLHVRMRTSEVDDNEWAGSVVDGALREFAPRGRVFYETKRAELGNVARDCDFAPHAINLACDYDEMIGKISP